MNGRKFTTHQSNLLKLNQNRTIYCKPIPQLTPEQIERLFSNASKKDTGCWEWTKCRDPYGYGVIRINSSNFRAHRLSWVATHGHMAQEFCVLHKCDNPSCINPEHLFLGTHQDNARDCAQKMRQARPKGESNGQSILTEKKVRLLREFYTELLPKQNSLAKIAGVAPSSISQVLNRKAWSHV